VAALAAAMAVIVALDMTRVAGFEEDEPARAELVVFLRRQYIFSAHRLQEWIEARNGLDPGAPAGLVPEASGFPPSTPSVALAMPTHSGINRDNTVQKWVVGVLCFLYIQS
jgi:hypothetical protein